MRALALMALFSLVALPAVAQETTQPLPPEHMQRQQGPSYGHTEATNPTYRDAGQFPHLSGQPPSSPKVPSVVPPQPRCQPQNSTVPSYDPQNSATTPPSCP